MSYVIGSVEKKNKLWRMALLLGINYMYNIFSVLWEAWS